MYEIDHSTMPRRGTAQGAGRAQETSRPGGLCSAPGRASSAALTCDGQRAELFGDDVLGDTCEVLHACIRQGHGDASGPHGGKAGTRDEREAGASSHDLRREQPAVQAGQTVTKWRCKVAQGWLCLLLSFGN